MNLPQLFTMNDLLGELTVIYRRTKTLTKSITSSNSAYNFVLPYMDSYLDNHEEFLILHLTTYNTVCHVQNLSKGGRKGTVVDIKMIFRDAIILSSSGLILVHNHPSGNIKPSQADIDTTNKIKEVAKFHDIKLLDHLILTRESYFSFADDCIL